jgi:hypothetical protein
MMIQVKQNTDSEKAKAMVLGSAGKTNPWQISDVLQKFR